MIFVAICSYRDSELEHTIADCIAKAKWPHDLRFGIFAQGEEGCGFPQDERFRLMGCEWQEARGLGWARAQCQTMYDGEEYALQLDGHMRFAPEWDKILIEMLELTGSPKPVLGSYAGVYDPSDSSKPWPADPCKMVAWEFTPSGTIKFRPSYIPNWKELNTPIPARFMSGHFAFVPGKWHEEFKFDPEIFFAGEEISMAIRSFTMGYDLFHPHRQVILHEYLRKHRVKVWDDHQKDKVEIPWGRRDEISKRRIRKLLREEDNDEVLGQFDLGTQRGHRDFELYAGINFSERVLHPDATKGIDPPCGFDGTEPDPDVDETYYAIEDRKGRVLKKWFAMPGENHKLVTWKRSKSKGWGERKDILL